MARARLGSDAKFPRRAEGDTGNAERLIDRYADRIRWVTDNGHWAVFNHKTHLWDINGADDRAAGLMRKTFERMMKEEGPHYTGDERERWFKYCKSQGSARALRGALEVAKTKSTIHARMSDFDADKTALHCANGILDLEELELYDHEASNLMTVGTPVAYKEGAQCEKFSEFLDAFLPEQEVREYLQVLLGYSLLAGNREKLLVMVKGRGNSGKSSLNTLMSTALGSYAQGVELSMFKANNQRGKADPALAQALPARYIAATEAGSAWSLHADQIKRMTGEDKMQARFLYGRGTVDRYPAFTPWIFTNEMPQVNGRDAAFMDRLIVIPMNSKPKVIDRLATSLMKNDPASLEAVLAWVVEGLALYLKDGLPDTPEAVEVAIEGSVADMSLIDAWLSDECEMGVKGKERGDSLYRAYEQWCEFNTIKEADRLNAIVFGRHLGGLGLRVVPGKVLTKEGRKSVRFWHGIGLK